MEQEKRFFVRGTATLVATFALVLVATQAAFGDAELDKGKEVFNGAGACASCHGALGKGDGAAAAALTPKPRDLSSGIFSFDTDGDGKKGTEADLFNVITNGAQKYGGSMMMVARPDLPEADRKALAKYVMSLSQK